ncbi:MAG: sigma-70 family RNA polymerase sigma factor [Egibacteraceae bacterium]
MAAPCAGEPSGSADPPRLIPEIHALVTSAQQGCAQSFAGLYDRYVGEVSAYMMRRVGNRATAEDLTADVFMRALGHIGSYQQRNVDFGAWLQTIARNRVNDHFKSAPFRLEASVDEVFETPCQDRASDPETALLSREATLQVRTALRQLTGEQAEVLNLRFIQYLDVPQTAAAMGKTSGAVRALQHRALRSLARLVLGQDP